MWIHRNTALSSSGCWGVNFLFNQDKFYVMDNHLAAAWCWIQKIRARQSYGLFHIDQHYDLLNSLSTVNLNSHRTNLTGRDFNLYRNEKTTPGDSFPMMRYDNYITAFEKLYPGIFSRIYQATHDEGSDETGTDLETIENWKPEIWELPNNINYWITKAGNTPSKWIINLDLDYFFSSKDSDDYQLLTDEYIRNICKEIENSLDNIDVVTIALSPEFCGGWEYSFRIMDIISDHFSLGFEHTW